MSRVEKTLLELFERDLWQSTEKMVEKGWPLHSLTDYHGDLSIDDRSGLFKASRGYPIICLAVATKLCSARIEPPNPIPSILIPSYLVSLPISINYHIAANFIVAIQWSFAHPETTDVDGLPFNPSKTMSNDAICKFRSRFEFGKRIRASLVR
jgi:hypothetical protein